MPENLVAFMTVLDEAGQEHKTGDLADLSGGVGCRALLPGVPETSAEVEPSFASAHALWQLQSDRYELDAQAHRQLLVVSCFLVNITS